MASANTRQDPGHRESKPAILPDLPEHLSQDLFSNGGREHDVAVRFATSPVSYRTTALRAREVAA